MRKPRRDKGDGKHNNKQELLQGVGLSDHHNCQVNFFALWQQLQLSHCYVVSQQQGTQPRAASRSKPRQTQGVKKLAPRPPDGGQRRWAAKRNRDTPFRLCAWVPRQGLHPRR